MSGRQSPGDTLGGWLLANGLDAPDGPGGIADVARVRALLVAAAREGRAMTYSEILGALGHRFTRPKMRALCATLDRIDTDGAAAGEPGLAVLVVRQSDGLPGQGWWIGAAVDAGYMGEWIGPDAATFVRARQAEAFRYWGRG
ncbi:ribose-phosphate pyrophosphokinase [uncultured Sphingomonas sp.]|uniref:ribose-phosphate pyrophosphokinase n=1 Tax=uncultured Sphingomonas sp. TaxID=158754 RepID=UPI0025E5B8D7|nr:ribose-phosphate pyrophosphokinase [uncultured Sphingomonas sp.]